MAQTEAAGHRIVAQMGTHHRGSLCKHANKHTHLLHAYMQSVHISIHASVMHAHTHIHWRMFVCLTSKGMLSGVCCLQVQASHQQCVGLSGCLASTQGSWVPRFSAMPVLLNEPLILEQTVHELWANVCPEGKGRR